jgi:hypothetical protein
VTASLVPEIFSEAITDPGLPVTKVGNAVAGNRSFLDLCRVVDPGLIERIRTVVAGSEIAVVALRKAPGHTTDG